MNMHVHRVPTIEHMRDIVTNSLKMSGVASNILRNSKYICDIVDGYRYEQRWQDKITLNFYCAICEDVRLSKLAIKLIPLDCPM